MYIVVRLVREYFTHIETSPLSVKGCKNNPTLALMAFEKTGRGLYQAIPAMTRDFGLHGLIRRTTPFSHLLQ